MYTECQHCHSSVVMARIAFNASIFIKVEGLILHIIHDNKNVAKYNYMETRIFVNILPNHLLTGVTNKGMEYETIIVLLCVYSTIPHFL